MAMAQSRKARKAYEKDTADFIRRAEEGLELAEQRGDDVFNMASVSMSYEDSALAGEISRYAQSKRAEYIAELLTHMLPGKKTKYVNIKDEHFEMLSEFLDIPVSRLRELYRKSMDNRTGWL
jgi:hemoglobin-like flavoprotein